MIIANMKFGKTATRLLLELRQRHKWGLTQFGILRCTNPCMCPLAIALFERGFIFQKVYDDDGLLISPDDFVMANQAVVAGTLGIEKAEVEAIIGLADSLIESAPMFHQWMGAYA